MNRIVWLASYPKSGNTWLRVFLCNLRADGSEPIGINALHAIPGAAGRDTFDAVTGLTSSELAPHEIAPLRRAVYEHLSGAAPEPILFKVHDAFEPGGPLSERATRGAVYVVRNPLDVAVSWAHHADASTGPDALDDAITFMASPAAMLETAPASTQLPQRLLSWSDHVASWLDAGLDLHLVRYEDLQREPLAAFTRLARFVGWPSDEARVARAAERSRFGALRRQEESQGFAERGAAGATFFRKGRAGGWREALTPAQVERIVADHGRMMGRLGYLDADGRPTDAPVPTSSVTQSL